MDEFPHIAVEHKVLKRRVQFKFNPERCRQAGFEETPDADKYEVIKLRRVYHFNKDTSDHVVLTIPKPVFVVVDKDHIPEENSPEINHNGECAKEQKTTYQNVKNRKRKSEECSCESSEDEVIIEKCVPQVVTESKTYKKQTQPVNDVTESFYDVPQPKSTIICNEYKSKSRISKPNVVTTNNQGNHTNISDKKRKSIQLSNVAVDRNLQTSPTDFVNNIQSHDDKIVPTEELAQAPQSNKEVIEDELDFSIVFDEFSVNELILNEENSNIQDIIFGLPSEMFEPTSIEEISATDEILWTELCESSAGGPVVETLPQFYQEDLNVPDPVEEEMRKIHGEYVVQEHSYGQPLVSKEDMEFASNRNFNILEMFAILEPENIEDDYEVQRPVDEPFEMQPLAIEEENDEELGSEIEKFIFAQKHSFAIASSQESVAKTQEDLTSFDTFKAHPEFQEPVAEENPIKLGKVQKRSKCNNPKDNCVIQCGVAETEEIQETIVEMQEKFKTPLAPKMLLIQGKSVVDCSEEDPTTMERHVQEPTEKEPEVVKESIQNSFESENLKKSVRISVIVKPKNLVKIKTIQNSIQTKLEFSENFLEKDTTIMDRPIQAFQIFEKLVQPKFTTESEYLENARRDDSIEKRKILEQPIEDGLIPKEPQISDGSTKPEAQVLEEPAQDGPIIKETAILDHPIVKGPVTKVVSDSPIPKEPEILEYPIERGPVTKGLEVLEKAVPDGPITKELEVVPAGPIPKEPENLERPIAGPTKEFEVVPDGPISREPENLEHPIAGPITKELEVMKQPVQDCRITKEREILDHPIQEGTMIKEPQVVIQPTQNGAIIKETLILEHLIQDSATINQVVEQPLQDGSSIQEPLNLEQSVLGNSIAKQPQLLEKSVEAGPNVKDPLIVEQSIKDCLILLHPIITEPEILEQPIAKDPPVLEQLNQDSPIVNEPPILEQSIQDGPMRKTPQIMEQPIPDSPIINEPQILQQPTKELLIVDQLVQNHPISKDLPIFKQRIQDAPMGKDLQDGSITKELQIAEQDLPISKEPPVLKQPIQDSPLLNAPQIVEHPVQDSHIAKEPPILEKPIPMEKEPPITEHPTRDSSITKKLRPVENRPFAKEPPMLKQPIESSGSIIESQIMKQPIQDGPLEKEPRVMEQPTQDGPIAKDPRVLKQPIQDGLVIKQPQILEQPIEDAPTTKGPQVMVNPVQKGLIEREAKPLEECNPDVPLHKKSKILVTPIRCYVTDSKILEKPQDGSGEKDPTILDKPIQDRIIKVPKILGKLIIPIHNEYKFLEIPVLNPIEKFRDFESTSRKGPKILQNFLLGTIEKVPAKPKCKILDNSLLNYTPKIVESSYECKRQKIEEKPLQGSTEKVPTEQEPKIWEKQKPKILQNLRIMQNPVKGKGHIIVDKCLDGTIARAAHQNRIKQNPKSLKKPLEKDPRIIENPIESKRCKIVKAHKSAVEVPKDSEAVVKTLAKPIVSEPKILKGTIQTKFNKILAEHFQGGIEKVLKVLDKPVENNPKPHPSTAHSNTSKIPSVKQPKILNSVLDIIKSQEVPQSPKRPTRDAIRKQPHACVLLSPKAFNGRDIFEDVNDSSPPDLTPEIIPDPLEEEMRRIHEDSFQENEILKEKTPLADLNKEPVNKTPFFEEPVAKIPRLDDLEEEELDFRGFTREEQNRTSDVRSVRDSPVSVIDFDKSTCSTPVTELKENALETPTKLNGLGKRTRRAYKCDKCDFRTTKQRHLKVHARAHVQPFWCSLCSEMFSNSDDLEHHVKRFHDVDKINCKSSKNKTTTEKFVDVATLGKSLRNSRTGEEPFKIPNKQAYKCGFCDYSSSYIKRLQHHVKVHMKEKLYNCDECNYATLTKWMMERHKNDHVKEAKQYECDECGYISVYRDQLDEHLRLHSSQKVYKCDKCSFSTAHLGYFNAHIGFHQPKNECSSEYGDDDDNRKETLVGYTCRECGYYTRQQSTLLKHARRAHEHKMHMRVLARSSNKEIHMCTQCGFWAQSKEAFDQHFMIHTDIKPIKCELCDFVTDTEFNLKVHEASHSRENVFRCTKCNRNCWTLQRFKDHTVQVHNGDVRKLFH